MVQLMTFDGVINKATKPHLLLGNGFSMAYDKERFSFTNLLQSAVDGKIIKKSSEIYQVFQKLATADFESVMKLLDESEQILEVYGGGKALRKKLKTDAKNLKDYLVQIITNNHPEKSTVISLEEKQACLVFLRKFEGNIYTLNYDLLLYWATMTEEGLNFSDGFGNTDGSMEAPYVVYKNLGSFRVHYLHGGLHIFDAGSEIIKITYVNSNISLIDQIRSSLSKKEYPIFISEGDSAQKMTKIIHNAYLNHCYKSLKTISGDLVIFGTQLKKNDEHILDAILQNKVKNIFIGVSNTESIVHIEKAVEQYNKNKPNEKQKKLNFFDYRTVNVWGK